MTDDARHLRLQLDRLRDEIQRRRSTEEQVRQSEERFRSLVENSHDVVYRLRLTPRLSFDYISPMVVDLTGRTASALCDDPTEVLAAVHPDDRPLLQDYLERGDFAQPLTLRCQHMDCREIWLQQRALPVYDETGDRVLLEGIVRECSDRRHVL